MEKQLRIEMLDRKRKEYKTNLNEIEFEIVNDFMKENNISRPATAIRKMLAEFKNMRESEMSGDEKQFLECYRKVKKESS